MRFRLMIRHMTTSLPFHDTLEALADLNLHNDMTSKLQPEAGLGRTTAGLRYFNASYNYM
jgi:hypothetical protein